MIKFRLKKEYVVMLETNIHGYTVYDDLIMIHYMNSLDTWTYIEKCEENLDKLEKLFGVE